MNKELQVCTLEQAQKLKAFGIKQLSEYYYINEKLYSIHAAFESHIPVYMYVQENVSDPDSDVCSAFNVAELGELIPDNFTMPMRIITDGKVSYFCLADGNYYEQEAIARAAAVINFHQNKLTESLPTIGTL